MGLFAVKVCFKKKPFFPWKHTHKINCLNKLTTKADDLKTIEQSLDFIKQPRIINNLRNNSQTQIHQCLCCESVLPAVKEEKVIIEATLPECLIVHLPRFGRNMFGEICTNFLTKSQTIYLYIHGYTKKRK